jgi:hypothetical protein
MHMRTRRFWQSYGHHRYAILFYSLLFMLVAMPVANAFGLPQFLMRVVIGGCLLAAVMPNATRTTRQLLIAAVLLLVLARSAAERDYLPMASGPVLALFALTGLIAAALALRFAIKAETVDDETIYAALSTYLLAGVFFGLLYAAIEFMEPGSFIGPDEFNESNSIYYSFVTLATLGYGDFLPKTQLARGIATFEVIGGQLYLAVMVARLIGAFGVKGGQS